MRAVVQRVSQASVAVDGDCVGQIDSGLLVLLGVGDKDTESDLQYVYQKTLGLRVFEDAQQKMNLSVQDVGGALLVVSQFTLYGDVRRGRRPSFVEAARPEMANAMYEQFCELARADQIDVATGIFQADMQVSLVNDGPVTILIDSRKGF